MTEPPAAVFQEESDDAPTRRHYDPEALLVDAVGHNIGDDSPRGVDKSATCKRSAAAMTCVANGPMSTSEFRTALRNCLEQHRLVRLSIEGTEHLTLPEPQHLKRLQREAGERGDSETVGRVHRVLDAIDGGGD